MALEEKQRRTPNLLVTIACLVVVIAGLKAAQALLVPFTVAVFLAVLGFPPLFWLQQRKVPTPIAVLIVLLVMIGALALVGTLVSSSINSFIDAAPRYEEKLNNIIHRLDPLLQRLGSHQGPGSAASDGTTTPTLFGQTAPDQNVLLRLLDSINPNSVVQLAVGTLTGLAGILSNTLLVMLTLAFILFEAAGVPQKLRAALGRPDADLTRFALITDDLQRYLVIKTITSLGTGIVLGIWCALLHVDFPFLWGVVAFALNYIPTIGSIIAAIPPILLALVGTGSVGHALAVAAGYIVVNFTVGNFIEPSWMGRRLGLSTLVVFLSLVFWGWVWGPVGMLLSVPLTMILKILLENTEEFRWVAILLGPAPAPPAPKKKPPPG